MDTGGRCAIKNIKSISHKESLCQAYDPDLSALLRYPRLCLRYLLLILQRSKESGEGKKKEGLDKFPRLNCCFTEPGETYTTGNDKLSVELREI